jgi:hypothetical protein
MSVDRRVLDVVSRERTFAGIDAHCRVPAALMLATRRLDWAKIGREESQQ